MDAYFRDLLNRGDLRVVDLPVGQRLRHLLADRSQ
jgi:hypothetical protein